MDSHRNELRDASDQNKTHAQGILYSSRGILFQTVMDEILVIDGPISMRLS